MNSVEMGLQLLGPEECDILKLLYPRFSNEEIQNRRSKLLAEMEKQKIDALLVAEFLFTGSAAHWITNWPATTATIVLLVPDQPVHIIVEHYNHLPHAQKMVTDAEVIWGKRIPLEVAQQTIKKLKQSVHRLGVIGRLSPDEQETIAVGVEEIVDFNSTYRKIRLVKSEEELHWIRIGALFSDMALDAMV
ncbi:uncharacterized protein METZ01_LOCUS428512, partial [marine metagenome]